MLNYLPSCDSRMYALLDLQDFVEEQKNLVCCAVQIAWRAKSFVLFREPFRNSSVRCACSSRFEDCHRALSFQDELAIAWVPHP
jgi:hypothetical protein